MQNLEGIDVTSNRLSGTLPSLLRNTYLRELILAYNRFEGTIPSAYGNFADLSILILNHNQGLTGSIPEEFLGLVELGENTSRIQTWAPSINSV
jgi:hypothetical protein